MYPWPIGLLILMRVIEYFNPKRFTCVSLDIFLREAKYLTDQLEGNTGLLAEWARSIIRYHSQAAEVIAPLMSGLVGIERIDKYGDDK